MDGMNEETIQRLVDEAVIGLGAQKIYSLALPNVDVEAMKEAEPITRDEWAATLATAGFMAGIRFTLENLTQTDEDPAGTKD